MISSLWRSDWFVAANELGGDAGRTYRLQRASNPAGPWNTLVTLAAPSEGTVEQLDPAPITSPAFYRVAAP